MRVGPQIQVPVLAALVEEVYVTFERPPPADLGVCTVCCMPDQTEQRILRTPQRAIALDDVREWYSAARASDGIRLPVCWMLPRALEFLSCGIPVAMVGDEVTLSRLGQSGFPDAYTADQVDVLNRFAVEFTAALLQHPAAFEETMSLDTCLCMFASAGVDLAPILRRLDDCATDDVVRSLVCRGFVEEIGFTAFWEKGAALDAAMAWFHSPTLQDRLTAYVLDDTTPDQSARDASALLDVICP